MTGNVQLSLLPSGTHAKARRTVLARGVHRNALNMLEALAAPLEKYMTLLSVREKLSASNIANVDTPGYRTRDIDFQAEMQSAMAGRNVEVVETQGLMAKNDGNNVSLDREARLLAENALRFNIASNLTRSALRQVRMAIQEGGGAA